MAAYRCRPARQHTCDDKRRSVWRRGFGRCMQAAARRRRSRCAASSSVVAAGLVPLVCVALPPPRRGSSRTATIFLPRRQVLKLWLHLRADGIRFAAAAGVSAGCCLGALARPRRRVDRLMKSACPFCHQQQITHSQPATHIFTRRSVSCAGTGVGSISGRERDHTSLTREDKDVARPSDEAIARALKYAWGHHPKVFVAVAGCAWPVRGRVGTSRWGASGNVHAKGRPRQAGRWRVRRTRRSCAQPHLP